MQNLVNMTYLSMRKKQQIKTIHVLLFKKTTVI